MTNIFVVTQIVGQGVPVPKGGTTSLPITPGSTITTTGVVTSIDVSFVDAVIPTFLSCPIQVDSFVFLSS